MQEIIQIADRIVVFKAGKISGELKNSKVYGAMSTKIMKLIMD
jgi:ABC-type sugar transport system ATPase subunit